MSDGGESPPVSRRYVRARVVDVVEETSATRSFVLEIPEDHAAKFAYEAGQFLTVRITTGETEQIRCYSMSSAPSTDDAIKVTVKRHSGGEVSNWMHDVLSVGDTIEVLPPSGLFTLRAGTQDVLAFASGSGITPIWSIIKKALTTTDRKVRLFYANQHREAVIFSQELNRFAAIYRHRFSVVHHLYDEQGYVEPRTVRDFLVGHNQPDVYLCGSRRFTETVATTLSQTEVLPDRIFVESFTLSPAEAPVRAPTCDRSVGEIQTEEVVLTLRGRRYTLPYSSGESLLETARRGNITPPFACESGTCASCMAFLKEGDVAMTFNSALTSEEVADGWVLTCQGFPVSRRVVLEYPT